ncbi:MAG: hypothetical protein HW416_1399 [Chloroflexi bacterium]|nr:hypothetical protein [Chloroflexota bacterium]
MASAPNEPVRPRGTVKIAWGPEPSALRSKFFQGGSTSLYEVAPVFDSYLTYYDPSGRLHPMLARDLPTRDNGGLVVRADGTVVTTYRLRPDVKWHDGVPITARDYVFAFQVYLDPEVPVNTRVPENLMQDVVAADDYTIVITWKQPFFQATTLGYGQLEPIPFHQLGERYRATKAQFMEGPEWTTAYVSNGPFRLVQWIPGSAIIGRAVMDWFLGAPKIETVEIRFFNDPQTIIANLLAGEADLSNAPFIDAQQAVAVRDRWEKAGLGSLRVSESNVQYIEFQFRDVPNWQRALADQRVRQALLYGVNRGAVADLMTGGLAGQADAFIGRADPAFAAVDRAITKYPIDPGRANALLADAGWRVPATGGLAVDVAGRTLEMQLWRFLSAGAELEASVIVDDWKAIGIDASMFVIPAARTADTEFRVTFPSANITNRPGEVDQFPFISRNLPAPERQWRGTNRGSLTDPEMDRLHDAIMTALVPEDARSAAVALHSRISETAGFVPLYYRAEVTMVSRRLKGPVGEPAPYQPHTAWNIFLWELAD